jgi:hypothetical protein
MTRQSVRIARSLAFAFALVIAGCEGLLDVKNPNNVLEDDLRNPAVAGGIVNGALATVSQGIGYILSPYTVATDETRWIGSRDAWSQIDNGTVSDIYNEFVDGAWPFINEGRWTADNAVRILEDFDAQGRLTNRLDLARAYLLYAVVRVVIADSFDDFVFSNKTEAKPPIGRANMVQLYDQALSALAKARTIAESGSTASHTEMRRRALGMIARTTHAKAIWQSLQPKGTVPSNPYGAATGARAAAEAALATMTGDYKWQLDYLTGLTFNDFQWEIVGRLEMGFEPIPTDPVTGAEDVRMLAQRNDFQDRGKWSDRYAPITMVSAREMRLIIAEAKLAAGDAAGARNDLNTLREMNNLPPYSLLFDAATALKHERRANLYLQGRRLSDMFRFGIQDARWQPGSELRTTPGSFFPITIQERRANPFIN